MTDRQAQARAEAERRFPRPIVTPHRQVGRQDVFMEAVEWADANPQPRKVTRDRLRDTCAEHWPGIDPDQRERLVEMQEDFLSSLGIEVVDDE